MGDHRAHIKIELSMYGKTRKTDMSINLSPTEAGSDGRIMGWFDDTVYELYMTVYGARIVEVERALEERKEREEYARLKVKFESTVADSNSHARKASSE